MGLNLEQGLKIELKLGLRQKLTKAGAGAKARVEAGVGVWAEYGAGA